MRGPYRSPHGGLCRCPFVQCPASHLHLGRQTNYGCLPIALAELADGQFHTHFLQSYPGPTYGAGCTAVDSDYRHISWVFRTRALIVVLGSFVSRVGAPLGMERTRQRYSANKTKSLGFRGSCHRGRISCLYEHLDRWVSFRSERAIWRGLRSEVTRLYGTVGNRA